MSSSASQHAAPHSSVTVNVPLGDRAYDIHIGRNLLDGLAPLISPFLKRPQITIVTDNSVWAAQGHRLSAALKQDGIAYDVIQLPAGEATKSFTQLEALLDKLLDLGVERSDVVVAFGGGVIGDLVGFAAAILRRGIRFIQIPTTVLSQVDSSVGGKTGINTRHGKNLVGAFHQPSLVIADISTLDTLPDRHIKAGYAEVVKYGLIDDVEFFHWLEQNGPDFLKGDDAARIHAIAKSVEAKARIVTADEREGNIRALLNLGHTFGHALEAETGYSDALYHGEGVAIGMVLALRTSHKLGWMTADEVATAERHLHQSGLPTHIKNISGAPFSVDALWGHMQQDKKVSAGSITFVMSRGLGGAFLTKDVTEATVRDVLEQSQ